MARRPVFAPWAAAAMLAACAHAPPRTARPSRDVARHAARAPLPDVVDADWPMFRDDVERSGFAEGSTVGIHVVSLWQIPAFNTTAYGAAKGSPSVVGDVVYCGTDTGRFVAARVGDGAILWQVQFDGTTHGVHGSPAIVGDVAYIGAYDGTLHALDRFTGRERWRYHFGDQIGASPAVVPRWGLVFSAHELLPHGGAIAALDARTGDEIWRQPTEAHPHSSVAVDVQRALAFVGDNSGAFYAFDALTGQPRWRRQLEGGDALSIKTTPMVVAAEGLVVFGQWSGDVVALDAGTGATRWSHAIGGRIIGSTAYAPGLRLVYVGTPRGWIYALDVATGRERWRFQVGSSVLSSPAVSGDERAVVFGADDGRVYALSADGGALIWWIAVGGEVTGSPTLVGDRIYVATRHGALVALRTHD